MFRWHCTTALLLIAASACGYNPRLYSSYGDSAGIGGSDALISSSGTGGTGGIWDAGEAAHADVPFTASGGSNLDSAGTTRAGGIAMSGGVTGSTGPRIGTGGDTGGSPVGNGGQIGRDGETGTTGRTGGVMVSTGGVTVVAGGVQATGGNLGAGGVNASGGTILVSCNSACKPQEDCIGGKCVAFHWGGMICSTQVDCPAWTTCCSNQSCDGTRIPVGDGTSTGQFVVSGDALTVTDSITGLLWERAGSDERKGCTGTNDVSGDACTWSEAVSYCGSLNLGGLTGWRLPTVMELTTIVDYTRSDPCIDPTVFPNTSIMMFWTSSSYSGGDQSWKPVLGIYFDAGYTTAASTQRIPDRGGVRCVR